MAEGVAVFAQFAIYYYYYVPAFGVSIDFIKLFFRPLLAQSSSLGGGGDGWMGGWGRMGDAC